MDKIRRINVFGGPGSGKSTVAAHIFHCMKKMGHRYGFSVEFVPEYIKMWTYIPRPPKSWDNFYCQAKQIHHEDTILRSGTDFIVSDSPIFLQYFYTWHHHDPAANIMLDVHTAFEKMYSSINILLDRDGADYDPKGRYETYPQALEIDEALKKLMGLCSVPFKVFRSASTKAIMTYVTQCIEGAYPQVPKNTTLSDVPRSSDSYYDRYVNQDQ